MNYSLFIIEEEDDVDGGEGKSGAALAASPLLSSQFVDVFHVFFVSTRGENGTDYFRPIDQRKAYGTQKRIWSDSCRIRSRIRIVINGYRKGYGFTSIRRYTIFHGYIRTISDKISGNELLST
jgi:hypothetical protein